MTAVVPLLERGGPAAIVGFVIPIGIDAVEGQIGRAFTHIGKEVFEDKPTITDGDAATTVMFIGILFWVAASLQHSQPSGVSLGRIVLWAMSMLFGVEIAEIEIAINGSLEGRHNGFLREQLCLGTASVSALSRSVFIAQEAACV